jgi:hypothetical protein
VPATSSALSGGACAAAARCADNWPPITRPLRTSCAQPTRPHAAPLRARPFLDMYDAPCGAARACVRWRRRGGGDEVRFPWGQFLAREKQQEKTSRRSADGGDVARPAKIEQQKSCACRRLPPRQRGADAARRGLVPRPWRTPRVPAARGDAGAADRRHTCREAFGRARVAPAPPRAAPALRRAARASPPWATMGPRQMRASSSCATG